MCYLCKPLLIFSCFFLALFPYSAYTDTLLARRKELLHLIETAPFLWLYSDKSSENILKKSFDIKGYIAEYCKYYEHISSLLPYLYNNINHKFFQVL